MKQIIRNFFMEIDVTNKDKIAIVVVGYNRKNAISRLLQSLNDAYYPSDDIPLVISIDASNDIELYDYVRKFDWLHGEKFVNIQEERLGLKKHIFQCGELSRRFKAIALLEDDLFVSPFFYDYVEKAVNVYGEDDRIAEISLYKNESNGYAGLPFYNIQNGSDVFLMQDVSTWGQCWTEQMWDKFVLWRDCHTDEDIQSIDMPERIKEWERAWSKYYNGYVTATNRFVLYPNVSLTTNFSDAGEHGGAQTNSVQVCLLHGKKQYVLNPIEQLVTYDIYSNNVLLPEWIGIKPDEVCLDLYGIHTYDGKRYILSTRILPYKVVKSFALQMRPIELNVLHKVSGEGIYLYDTTETSKSKWEGSYGTYFVNYFLHGFDTRLIIKEAIRLIGQGLKNRLHI